MNELKPCPFCGDRGEVFVYYSCLNGSKWGVRCFSCGISQRVIHGSREEAIEAWNRRNSDDQ